MSRVIIINHNYYSLISTLKAEILFSHNYLIQLFIIITFDIYILIKLRALKNSNLNPEKIYFNGMKFHYVIIVLNDASLKSMFNH